MYQVPLVEDLDGNLGTDDETIGYLTEEDEGESFVRRDREAEEEDDQNSLPPYRTGSRRRQTARNNAT